MGCSVCECLLKDSSTYLEHVNGRRHNRNLGMNMKVEKIGVDRVREKLKAMSKKPEVIEQEDITERLKTLEEQAEEKKRKKKEKNKNKKPGEAEEDEDDITGDEAADAPAAKKQKTEDEDDDDDGPEEETEEQKMLKAMGLPTGFG